MQIVSRKSSQEQNDPVSVPRKSSRETNTAITTASHMDLDSIDVDWSQPEVGHQPFREHPLMTSRK